MRPIFNGMKSSLSKREIIFIVIGFILLILLIGLIIFSTNFLANNITKIFNQENTKQKVVKFNVEGLRELGIIK